MKTIQSIFMSVMLIVLATLSTSAQSKTKVIAVINEADWCPTCQHNGERAIKAFKANNKDGAFQFVINNLTNDDTKLKSSAKLKELGLSDEMSEFKGTGMVYFFNAKTKVLISKISIAKSDEELAKAMESANEGVCCSKSTGEAKNCASKEHSCG
ncbi:MAG: hypothetical protein GXO80_07905 [Chlorobi bacterium]|nr:hypothetical protein [Chlorobiota bacterium]